jgi:hypothetical protein
VVFMLSGNLFIRLRKQSLARLSLLLKAVPIHQVAPALRRIATNDGMADTNSVARPFLGLVINLCPGDRLEDF